MFFLQNVVSGLFWGSIYALAALGIVLVFITSGVVNFAHGEMAMFSTFIVYTLLTYLKLPLYLSIIISIGFAFLFGMAIERGLLRPVREKTHAGMMIITLGLLMILNGLATTIWGTQEKLFPSLVNREPIFLGSVVIDKYSLFVFIISIAIIVGLFLFLKLSIHGIAMRATVQDELASRLMGIRIGTVLSFTWGFSAILGLLAGVFVAPNLYLHSNMMQEIQIKAFTAAVLGGFTSIPGAIVGGLLLGVLENLIAAYITTKLKVTLSLIIIIVILLIRPHGLMGRKEVKRA